MPTAHARQLLKVRLKTVMIERTPGGGIEPFHPSPSSGTFPPDAVPQLSGSDVLSPRGLRNLLRPVPPQSWEPRNPAAATPRVSSPSRDAGFRHTITWTPDKGRDVLRTLLSPCGPRGPGIQSGSLRTVSGSVLGAQRRLAQLLALPRGASVLTLTHSRLTNHVISGKPRPFLVYRLVN